MSLTHPASVCAEGEIEGDEKEPLEGYFKPGKRYENCCRKLPEETPTEMPTPEGPIRDTVMKIF